MEPLKNAIAAAKSIQNEAHDALGPPEEAVSSHGNGFIPQSLVRGTRGYIEKICNQVNGCYSNGWYDACAVMTRRLIETLIIECFEKYAISETIIGASGDFLFLRDLIEKCVNEKSWNLGRGCKKALPRLKDIGDKSAHSRRFIAQKTDIEDLKADVRVVIQELTFLAGLK
jgi:hypothetical protein